jgi:hypothetical protein
LGGGICPGVKKAVAKEHDATPPLVHKRAVMTFKL